MEKISLDIFKRIMACDVACANTCIEIEFSIDGSAIFHSSWMGKLFDKDAGKPEYWFGLTKDGSGAYEFDSIEQLLDAKVFEGKSIKEIWDSVSLHSIDACAVEDRIPIYL